MKIRLSSATEIHGCGAMLTRLRVALVTKPLVAPHHDGTKVLVRELVRGSTTDVRFVYLGEPKRSVRWAAASARWRR